MFLQDLSKTSEIELLFKQKEAVDITLNPFFVPENNCFERFETF